MPLWELWPAGCSGSFGGIIGDVSVDGGAGAADAVDSASVSDGEPDFDAKGVEATTGPDTGSNDASSTNGSSTDATGGGCNTLVNEASAQVVTRVARR